MLSTKISIVTPSYNQAQFLEQTILSVLNQGYDNLEYIIMDGGSTDGSVDIIKKYSGYIAHWESKPDNGQADAIYRGFEMSTGDILGYVNSDDLLLPGCLEKVSTWFNTHKDDKWVVGGSIIIDNKGEKVLNRFGNPLSNLGASVTFNELLFYGNPFCQPASFWRRETFYLVGGFDKSLTFCFDYDLFLRLAKVAPSGNIRSFLAAFRFHAESKTSTIPEIQSKEHSEIEISNGKSNHSLLNSKLMYYYFLIINYSRAFIINLMHKLKLL